MAIKHTDGIRPLPGTRRTNSDIANIFHTEGGKVDMTRLERKKRNPRKMFYSILIAAAVLLIVAAAGFYFFVSKDKEFSGSSIELTTSMPERIAAGEDFPITLTFTNTEQVALNDLLLTMQFPDGYTVKSASRSAENEAKNAYRFGTLTPGAQNSLTLTGHITGAVGDERTFGLTFTFLPANFNYQFNETKNVSVRIASSSLLMDIEGPQELAPETTGTWTVKLTNTSSDAISALRVALNIPGGFTLESSDPALSDDKRWSVDQLGPGQERTLTFSGKFADTGQEFVELSLTSSIQRNGTDEQQGSATLLVLVVNPHVQVSLARAAGQEDAPVKPGTQVPVSLTYENTSELVLTDVHLIVTIDDASPVDAAQSETTPTAKIDGRTFTWTRDELTDLAQIRPGAKGEVAFSLSVPTTLVPGADTDFNPNVTVRAHATIGGVNDAESTAQSSDEVVLEMPVSTILSVSGEARYYSEEGVKIGSGPLPPKAGAATMYVIQWFVNNTTNDVKDFSLIATIPQTVFWTGEDVRASLGNLTFDPLSREVRWNIDTVPAGSGSLSETLTAKFSVRITPTANAVGSTPVLVDAAQVTGKDTHTDVTVGGSVETMTTDLLHDTRAAGKGAVAPSS